MDDNLNSQFDEILKAGGVTSVVCTDLHGLILKEKGNVSSAQAGEISSIAVQASKLFPDLNETPVVCLEGETKNCLIHNEEKIVLGIFKDKT